LDVVVVVVRSSTLFLFCFFVPACVGKMVSSLGLLGAIIISTDARCSHHVNYFLGLVIVDARCSHHVNYFLGLVIVCNGSSLILKMSWWDLLLNDLTVPSVGCDSFLGILAIAP
jgi:hypothetical protein